MSRRAFDRFMVDIEIGHNLKLVNLTDSEWRAHVGGILPIAAKSPIRGRLLIGDSRAEPVHVAHQAGVKPKAAESAMVKLRKVGVLIHDDEFDCERVHDFEAYNPPPKTDKTAAERQQRRRDRLRRERDLAERHDNVTPLSRRDDRDVTPPEVEGEVRSSFSHVPSGSSVREGFQMEDIIDTSSVHSIPVHGA